MMAKLYHKSAIELLRAIDHYLPTSMIFFNASPLEPSENKVGMSLALDDSKDM